MRIPDEKRKPPLEALSPHEVRRVDGRNPDEGTIYPTGGDDYPTGEVKPTLPDDRVAIVDTERKVHIEAIRVPPRVLKIPWETQAELDDKLSHDDMFWDGGLKLEELSYEPDDPEEGAAVIWLTNGSGAGSMGDVMIKITSGGVTKTGTLVNFSTL